MNSIHVLLVNDSLLVSRIILKILATEPQFTPIKWVKDGLEAEAYVQHNTPDVILMDIRMPNQGGVETTRKILMNQPIPILVLTATISSNMPSVFKMMQYGALDVTKPPQIPIDMDINKIVTPDLIKIGADFIQKIKIISKLKSKIKPNKKVHLIANSAISPKRPRNEIRTPSQLKFLIAIGTSTGGPKALSEVLKSFSPDIPAAIVIVQHIEMDFLPSLIEHLQQFSKLPVLEVKEGTSPQSGNIYIACKENHHLIFTRERSFKYKNVPAFLHMPSIDVLFESVGTVFQNRSIGVLLTGMGVDGAMGLKHIKNECGFTLAQDEKSSVVYGMPKAAYEMNACNEVLPLSKIGHRIMEYLHQNQNTIGNIGLME